MIDTILIIILISKEDLIEFQNLIHSVNFLGFVAYISNRFFFSGSLCTSNNRLDGKTVIITGPTSGVGKATALELAKRGIIEDFFCYHKFLIFNFARRSPCYSSMS